MQQIKINPFYERKEEEIPEISFLLPDDENYAITTDGLFVSLVKVAPDPDHPGEFKPDTAYTHMDVAIDDKRTLEGLGEVVQVLRTMTAYELLTNHFNQEWTTFFVNRDKEYIADFEEDKLHSPIVGFDGERY